MFSRPRTLTDSFLTLSDARDEARRRLEARDDELDHLWRRAAFDDAFSLAELSADDVELLLMALAYARFGVTLHAVGRTIGSRN